MAGELFGLWASVLVLSLTLMATSMFVLHTDEPWWRALIVAVVAWLWTNPYTITAALISVLWTVLLACLTWPAARSARARARDRAREGWPDHPAYRDETRDS